MEKYTVFYFLKVMKLLKENDYLDGPDNINEINKMEEEKKYTMAELLAEEENRAGRVCPVASSARHSVHSLQTQTLSKVIIVCCFISAFL